MAEAGNFAARGVGMDDAFLRRAHDHRLGFLQCGQRLAAVAGCDRFLDAAHQVAQLGAPPFVDLGAAGDLARSFAGGTGVGHAFSSLLGRAVQPAQCHSLVKSKWRQEPRRHCAPLIVAWPVRVNGCDTGCYPAKARLQAAAASYNARAGRAAILGDPAARARTPS